MKIFVISLISDTLRKEKLKLSFPISYESFNFINAINKHDIHNLTNIKDVDKNKIKMSDVEVACALSHILVYKKMIDEDFNSCIIFEDDIQGYDQNISLLIDLYKKLPKNSVLIAGGMDGLKSQKYLYGKIYIPGVYRIDPAYYRFLIRACCYVIPRNIAEKIVNKQESSLVRADEWGIFLKNEKQVYFASIFKHPLDLTLSHLENARRHELNGFFNKLIKEGVFFTVYNFILKIFLIIMAKIKGLERAIKKDS